MQFARKNLLTKPNLLVNSLFIIWPKGSPNPKINRPLKAFMIDNYNFFFLKWQIKQVHRSKRCTLFLHLHQGFLTFIPIPVYIRGDLLLTLYTRHHKRWICTGGRFMWFYFIFYQFIWSSQIIKKKIYVATINKVNQR